MKKNVDNKSADLLTVFDLLEILQKSGENLSSKELSKAISKLQAVKHRMTKREEAEKKKKAKEAREKAERLKKIKEEERIQRATSMDLPLDWENLFNSDERTQGVHADSVADGLILSLTELGRVDIEYISAVTAVDYKTVICALKGSIFQNPEKWEECFYQGWETSEEYLSGNLMRKLKIARQANDKYHGYFQENVEALERVLPDVVSSKDIYVTLGSPWVPPYIIDEFIRHLMDDDYPHYIFRTRHDEATGTWEIEHKSIFNGRVRSTNTYGTQRIQALYILEKTLNMKTIVVKDEVKSYVNASGTTRVVNEAETVAALEKQEKMIKEFQRWVWRDEKRKETLEEIFQAKYACNRRRIFDGSFLKFPTMSSKIQLYPYQKDAVARILFTPNTLLAHDVGSGKTYVMIAAGMELKRMGISKKNLYVVPNNIVGQWKNIFLTMYPQAKLLIVEPRNFQPSKREAVLEEIRDGDYDGIIMAYSSFELIPVSKEYYRETLTEQKNALDELIKNHTAMSHQKRKRDALAKALQELDSKLDDVYDTVYFDELGITRMFVDEAHNYKNVPLETKADHVLGISNAGSKKCQEMLDKVHILQKNNNGGGVVLATGTPITNSITDAYVMQQYLQSGELAMVDLQSFDSWVGMFAERTTEFEIDVDTSGYRLATRFAKFHNLPELTSLLSSIADFHSLDLSAGIPDTDGYRDAVVSKTLDFQTFLDEISARAERVRGGVVKRTEDNMLKITTDGRKAALDYRLVDPAASFTSQSKVARCVENVADIYFKTYQNRSTQLVFCDTSTPKDGFNLYDEMKRLLVNMGIPDDKIAYIHSATTEKQRTKLFAQMNSGEIRILIGSTFKLGLGVNVQQRLIALHHLDVPWRPADMTQREGRILRQGNMNPKVEIFRYITEGSFDAYSWQLLETKARFIADLLSGAITTRSGSDVDDTVLSYAEVKALAVGNPLVKERVELANTLTRYMTLQRKAVDNRMRLEKELMELPARIQHQTDLIEKCERDYAFHEERKKTQPKEVPTETNKEYVEKRKALRKRFHTAVMENVLEITERPLMKYHDFLVVLPANMTPEKPYVFLQREGKYYVELGETEVGNLQRLTNFLDNLGAYLEKLKERLQLLKDRERDIHIELKKDESYAEEIEDFKKKIEKIDKKLKVGKK